MEINYAKTPFTWWIETMDKKFWKPWVRELIVLFWLASSGKTELSYFTARKNAELWNRVLFLSLELPEYDMKLRIARKRAWINKYDFQTGNYTPQQKDFMEKEWNKLQQQDNLKIHSPEDKSIKWIMEELRQGYDDWYRMFFIDNLDKIVSIGTDENTRYQKITTSLQDFKNECNACIFLIHHAKKPDSKWVVYKRAGLAGMRWSQKIMDNATQLFEIYRELDPDEIDELTKAKVEIIQMKDTFEWANWFVEIYFYKSEYYDEAWYKQAKYEA